MGEHPGGALRARIASSLREFELDLELAVPAGACLALVGPSGAGKSTVLRAIAGLHRPGAGRVSLGDRAWFDTGAGVDLPPEARSCGFVFQDYALFPHLSVWRNVAFGLAGRPRAERRAASVTALAGLGVEELADVPPDRLSGGERQRVALARALVTDPAVLLLDEPLAALDSRTAAATARELAATLRGAEMPTVLVTHDFAQAAMLADEIAVIDRGAVVQRGTAAELSARPRSAFVADFAGAAVLLGVGRPGANGTTTVALEGGGEITSTDVAEGHVGAAVFPWEITLEPPGTSAHGSALNRVGAEVESVTRIGNRVRIGLRVPQPLVAEVTAASVARLGLTAGTGVVATWKATATRLVER
jgi:molybdate transport system ATP-binding protein